MATNVLLSPEQEEFARALVATGRYSDVSEVISSSLHLLQEQEERRKAFAKMIADAEAEAEKEGTYTIDEVVAELDTIIDGKA